MDKAAAKAKAKNKTKGKSTGKKKPMFKLCSLWMKEGENVDFMTGKITPCVDVIIPANSGVIVFENTSDKENSPIYDVFITEPYVKGEVQEEEDTVDSTDNF